MKAPTKIYAESAKKVAEIRRNLAENNNNVFAERAGINPQLASAIVDELKKKEMESFDGI